MRRSTSMSMYCTGTLVLQRNAPTGIRFTTTITLLQYGEMRSGVCGQRGSGGKAFRILADAMPTRSAPSALARAFTHSAVTGAIDPSMPDKLHEHWWHRKKMLLQPA